MLKNTVTGAGRLKAELWQCVWDERGKLFRLKRFRLGPQWAAPLWCQNFFFFSKNSLHPVHSVMWNLKKPKLYLLCIKVYKPLRWIRSPPAHPVNERFLSDLPSTAHSYSCVPDLCPSSFTFRRSGAPGCSAILHTEKTSRLGFHPRAWWRFSLAGHENL